MKVLQRVTEEKDFLECDCDGLFITNRYFLNSQGLIIDKIKDGKSYSDKYIVINYLKLFERELTNINSLLDILDRYPNIILSNDDIKLLIKIKKQVKKLNSNINIASKKLSKGINYFIYPNSYQSRGMLNDIVSKVDRGVNILVSSDNFSLKDNTMLYKLDTKLSNSDSVLIYSNKPKEVIKCIK